MIAKLEKRVAELSVSQESLNQTAIRRRQRFEDRKGVLISKRHLLDAQWIELVREKPVGIVSRAFFGGRAAAAAEIKRCMRIVESRRDDIDRELVAISAELNKPREKPKMSSADRQKMLRDQERSLADYRFLSRHIKQLFSGVTLIRRNPKILYRSLTLILGLRSLSPPGVRGCHLRTTSFKLRSGAGGFNTLLTRH
ncbi:hypothetical protein PQZ54_05005 [Luminiphilus sp.]|nr:hypothetical protein [Luminiphilus sp.]